MKKLAFAIFLAVALCFAGPLSAYARGGHGGGGGHAGGGFHGGGFHGGGFHGGGFHGGGFHHHGGRFFVGSTFAFGWPWYPWYPYWDYPPYGYYGYYGPSVIAQQQPVYIQPGQEQPYYWYYCQDSKTYYPYVNTCPGGWTNVVPPKAPPQSSEEGKTK